MDLSCGISGDMFISALADAGVDYALLEQKFELTGTKVKIETAAEKRNGIMGRLARITWEDEQSLRTLEHILPIIQRMDISEAVKQKSIRAFHRLADVEAMVHGISRDRVHFHEVGALDTLVDIVGTFWGLEVLEVVEITSSPMPWFGGKINISHGLVPLPAPATSILMQGKMICPSDHYWEIITPTGALLVDQLVSGFENGFQGQLTGSGVGFGSKEIGFNGLRVFLWEDETDNQYVRDRVWLLESNIDHLTGEEVGHFFQKIMDAGALDVIFLQGIMKKNRPGGQLQVICHDEDLARIREEFFRHTLTLGIRESRTTRSIMPRKLASVCLEGEQIKSKEAVFSGKSYFRPEMEDLSKLSDKKGMSLVQMRLKKYQQ